MTDTSTMAQLSPCADLVRQFDYDRFMTTLFAPPPEREALSALYGFNVEVARVREVVREPLLGHMRLQWWREALDAVFAGRPPRHAVAVPLADAVRRYTLDRAPFDVLIGARAADLDDDPPVSVDSLERYAADTSAPLTGLALTVLGVDGETPRAVGRDLAVAWALIGSIRALPFQARRGRSLLPEDLCRAAGVAPEERLSAPAPPSVRRVIATLAERAATTLARARSARAEVPRRAIPALLVGAMADLYLTRLRAADHDPYDRRVQTVATPSRLLRVATAAARGRY